MPFSWVQIILLWFISSRHASLKLWKLRNDTNTYIWFNLTWGVGSIKHWSEWTNKRAKATSYRIPNKFKIHCHVSDPTRAAKIMRNDKVWAISSYEIVSIVSKDTTLLFSTFSYSSDFINHYASVFLPVQPRLYRVTDCYALLGRHWTQRIRIELLVRRLDSL